MLDVSTSRTCNADYSYLNDTHFTMYDVQVVDVQGLITAVLLRPSPLGRLAVTVYVQTLRARSAVFQELYSSQSAFHCFSGTVFI